jgi:CubicO group peptidase (beta-lactamase class C family)
MRLLRDSRLLEASIVLVCALSCAHRAEELPPTRAGAVMREFLAAYESGKLEPLVDFFDTHGGEPDPLARRNRAKERASWVAYHMYPGVRRLVAQRVESSTDHTIAILGRSAVSDVWYRFTIELEPQPPGGLSFGFEDVPAPAGFVEPARVDVSSYVRRIADADFFSGTLMIADETRTIHASAVGFRDQEQNEPNTLETQINLGSANKMFTAVATMQLVERGILALNVPIGRYLPDYPNRDAAQHVTIHHLLTHTSGVADYFNQTYMKRKKELRSVADLLPLFAEEPLAFRPGEKWAYSNGGYALLGRIIEVASGVTYEEYVQKNVFAPAGMSSTSGDPRAPYAHGYTFVRPGGVATASRTRNDFAVPGTGSPAGGGYSTVGDLVSFARALRSGKLVSEESLERMLTRHAARDDGTHYGYGFSIASRGGETVVGHNGHHFGISAQLDIHLATGVVIAALSNYDPPSAPAVARRLGELAVSSGVNLKSHAFATRSTGQKKSRWTTR